MIALAIIALIIFGICMITVGAEIEYIGGMLKISAAICGVKVQLFPRQKKKEKPEKPKEEAPKPEEEKPPKPKKKRRTPNFNRDELLELVKRGIRGLGTFGKVTVNRFLLHILVGGRDPYETALGYGWLNTALSSLAPLCSAAFNVRHCDVQTGVDFTSNWTEFDAALGVRIRISQVLRMVFAVLWGAVIVLVKNRIRTKKEKKLSPPAPEAEKTEEITENDNTVPGERNEENGNE